MTESFDIPGMLFYYNKETQKESERRFAFLAAIKSYRFYYVQNVYHYCFPLVGEVWLIAPREILKPKQTQNIG